MSQTFLGLAATDFWSQFRALIAQGREAPAAAPLPDEDAEQESERSRLPEQDESFYWGVGRFGYW